MALTSLGNKWDLKIGPYFVLYIILQPTTPLTLRGCSDAGNPLELICRRRLIPLGQFARIA